MKLRFTEDSIVVVDELNNSVVIDKETIKRVFNLQEIKVTTPVALPSSQEKILSIIRANQIKSESVQVEGNVNEDEEKTSTVPVSVARRYDPVEKESEDGKENRLAKVIVQLNEALFSKVFRGKIEVISFSELPTSLQQRYMTSIKKYNLCDNFKKNVGRTIGSVRLSKQWQTFQKELLTKYHEDRRREKEEAEHA